LVHARQVVIFMATSRAQDLRQVLESFGGNVIFIDPAGPDAALRLASATGDVLLVGPEVPAGMPGMPGAVWLDLLNGINMRLPVMICGSIPESANGKNYRGLEVIPESEGVEGVVLRLRSTGILQPEVPRRIQTQVADMDLGEMRVLLRKNGVLSVLCVNATKLRKLATRFGNDAFEEVVAEVRRTLLGMWGEPGSFRAEDLLCHRRDDSLVFYVVLENARGRDLVPAPGTLERLGERLTSRLLGRLWRATGNPKGGLPSFVSLIPEIGTGHATTIHNPAVDCHDQIVQLLESAHELSRSQIARVRERQRELLMTLIKSDELIAPAYQAVFNMAGMDLSKIDSGSGLQVYKDSIYGFESLIRVKTAAFDQRVFADLVGHFDSKILRPDVLFALAHENHLALELDQSCMSHAIRGSAGLPGDLMVNILPRNLYQVEAVKAMTGSRKGIVLEVSESEEIGNYGKLSEVCAALRGMELKIAADDFGKGFSGLDRIVKMRPDIVKFDRSLIDGIDRDPARQAFLKSMLSAAKLVGAKVLAEGVERVEEAKFCQDNGVDLVQGYLFHRPQFRVEIDRELVVTETESGPVQGPAIQGAA
jgi:EAL domain-containing protein (putative c-di-GMP-specific phosphodiesterase class I)